jgi:cysteine desulfurase
MVSLPRKYYFDYAASAPPYEEALKEHAEASLGSFGNPSSAHGFGAAAREALQKAKSELSKLCGFSGGALLVTSGGTEGNNLVINGVMDRYPRGRLLLAKDVHASCWFAEEKYRKRTDSIGIDSSGRLSPAEVRRKIRPATQLCSIVFGNNETGIVHDVKAIGEICREHGVMLHCDGVQAMGHLPLTLDTLAFDFFTFSAHKFGGPRGVGGIFLRSSDFASQINGGGQEQSMRAGTENVAGLQAAAKAFRLATENLAEETARLRDLGRHLVGLLEENELDFVINSDQQTGLPGLVSVSFPGLRGSVLVTELALGGFGISAGSACHSAKEEASRVILAMGRSRRVAEGTIRISMGRYTLRQHVTELAELLVRTIRKQMVSA